MRQLPPSKSYTQEDKENASRLRKEIRESDSMIRNAETMEREGKLTESECRTVIAEMRRRISKATEAMKKII